MSFSAKEPQNQVQFEQYRQNAAILGPYTTFMYRRDPRHLGFLLARYKFCSKILEGRERVLEVGCGDAFGIPVVAQTVKFVHGIDFEPMLMEDNARRLTGVPCTFECLDITERRPSGTFDGAYSLDVIEHIPREKEPRFFENICASLIPDGVFVIGTPNATANAYASEASRAGHINLKAHAEIRELMERYFRNVFVFSMNDEVVHTGFGPMAHYLFALGVSTKG